MYHRVGPLESRLKCRHCLFNSVMAGEEHFDVIIQLLFAALKDVQRERDLLPYMAFFRPFHRSAGLRGRNPHLRWWLDRGINRDILNMIGSFLIPAGLDVTSIWLLVDCCVSFRTLYQKQGYARQWFTRYHYDSDSLLDDEDMHFIGNDCVHKFDCLDGRPRHRMNALQFRTFALEHRRYASTVAKYVGLDAATFARTHSLRSGTDKLRRRTAQVFPLTTYMCSSGGGPESTGPATVWCTIL